jgi:uncharacterized membrane protein
MALGLLDQVTPELPRTNAWLITMGILLLAAGITDGWRSHFTRRGTTNRNRIVYGSLAGAGIYLLAAAW